MTNALKHAERLLILKELGNGILDRVHQVKRVYTGKYRPTYIQDPQYKKVFEVLLKKFPEFDQTLDKVIN